jgi:single-strand DNA-binding protein
VKRKLNTYLEFIMSVVIINGRLGQDIDLRFTAAGKPVAAMSVADTRYFNKNGEMASATEWHRVIVWGERGDRFAKRAGKGDLIEVHGELRYREYQDKDGKTVRVAEIIASFVKLLAKHDKSDNRPIPVPPKDDGSVDLPGDDFYDDDIPF